MSSNPMADRLKDLLMGILRHRIGRKRYAHSVTDGLRVGESDAVNLIHPGIYPVSGTDGIRMGDSAVGVLAGPGSAPITTYFNSLEPGGDGSDPNILLADDFSRGYWFLTYQSLNPTPLNAGWNGTPYGEPDPLGLDFGRAGVGINGGTCATNGGHPVPGDQARAMGDHSLAVNTSTEIYWRYYVKVLSGYKFGQEKALTFNKGVAGSGGIFFGVFFFGTSASGAVSCEPSFLAINQDTNFYQNQGVDQTMTGGNWYFLEMHLKLNGNGSDVVEMWMDNLGPNGTNVPASPTLRMRHTNVQLRPGGDSTSKFGSVWLENWANPPAVGEMYYDQIMVSKVGPIGFIA